MAREQAKVLLVDDDRDLLQLIAMRLQGAGYAVTAVESGQAALAALAVARPQVVVTDLRMEGLDGIPDTGAESPLGCGSHFEYSTRVLAVASCN